MCSCRDGFPSCSNHFFVNFDVKLIRRNYCKFRYAAPKINKFVSEVDPVRFRKITCSGFSAR